MEIDGIFFNASDYQLNKRKCIGTGSFGDVYIATNVKNKEEYAAKILKTINGFDGKEQRSFLRETLILHKVNHPAILKLQGINFLSLEDSSSLQPTILTEYLKNSSLRKQMDSEKNFIANPNWTPTKHYITLLGVADAMQYLHSLKIIHRDLKPDNILMDEDFFPRVSDFGLSRTYADNLMQLTMTNEVGTPLYMAPEIFEGDTHYGPAVDVFAFSMIAYELVSGKEPYFELKNKNPLVLTNKVLSGYRPQYVESITPKMWDLLCRCWNQKPEERPSFEEIFNKLSTDLSYYGEYVNQSEIDQYLSILDENRLERQNQTRQTDANPNQKERVVELAPEEYRDEYRKYPKPIHNEENEKKIQEQQDQIDKLNMKLAEILHAKSQERIEHKKQIDQLNEKLAEYENFGNHKMDESKQQINELNDKLRESEEARNRDLAKYKKQINELNAKLEAKNQEFVQQEKNMEQMKIELETLKETTTQNLNEYLIKNDELLARLTQATKESEFYKQQENELKSQIQSLQQISQNFESQLNTPKNMDDSLYTGLMNLFGYGNMRSIQRAYTALDMASSNGNSTASFIIGLLFEVGVETRTDMDRAITYYERAFQQGNTKGYNRIGYLYLNSKVDYQKAYAYLKKASDLDDPFASNNLALLYQSGHLGRQDMKKAIALFEKAAAQNEPFALFNLAQKYENGQYYTKNLRKAYQLYCQAARYGHPCSEKYARNLERYK